ncbi:MAG: hypothetical protein V3S43_06495 [Acidimicrobiia bacterium]
MPSALFIGDSGTGKTHAIATMIAAGLHVCHVPVEPKRGALLRARPLIIDINELHDGKRPTAGIRWDRLQRFADELGNGGYREFDGRDIDAITVDGITEVGSVIHMALKPIYDKTKTLIMWEEIGIKTVDFVNTLRDAADYSSTKFGLRPMAIIATCGETVQVDGDVTRFVPLLPGKKAAKSLAYPFEVIWRFSAGPGAADEHEFRIHTQKGEDHIGKSPVGVFDLKVISGAGVDVDGSPDAGKMYMQLLENKKSPYYRKK